MKFREIKKKFLRLSFKKKLLLAFTLSTFITLLITNIIMHVLLNFIGKEDDEVITTQNQRFNEVSTMQIIQSVAKVGLTSLDRFSEVLLQIVRAYNYFKNNSQMYTSLETINPYFPNLTQSFTTVDFASPAVYFLSPNTTFHNDSYIDVVLSNIAKNKYPGIKRINIFYINSSNANDLMVRTLPGTNDFIINNVSDVKKRMSGLSYDYYKIISNYTDQLTKSPEKDLLISLRTIVHSQNRNIHIVVQIQIYQAVLINIVGGVYYFPSTNVLFLQSKPNGQVNILSSLKPVMINLTPALIAPGYLKNILSNGTKIISGSVGVQNLHKLGEFSSFTNSNSSQYRFLIVTDEKQSSLPYQIMHRFIDQQSFSILIILYTWGGFILLVSAGISIVVGNHVFHHLHFLASKAQQYIKKPSSLPTIVQQLNNGLQIKGTIKRLIDGLIAIMQKIESRKKQITSYKSDQNQYKFPLNICYRQFQKRMGMQDYIIMDKVYQQLCKKYPQQGNIQ